MKYVLPAASDETSANIFFCDISSIYIGYIYYAAYYLINAILFTIVTYAYEY